eukprot:scaffold8046_cov444-Prasinococcus_capsulatus_cf.AAC.1
MGGTRRARRGGAASRNLPERYTYCVARPVSYLPADAKDALEAQRPSKGPSKPSALAPNMAGAPPPPGRQRSRLVRALRASQPEMRQVCSPLRRPRRQRVANM